MNKQNATYPFEFSPKLIRFLGEELIHDKKIAIAELIKNAYDADASKVLLTIANHQIIIEDDGFGMNEQVIRESWLKVGDSIKSKNAGRTPRYQRLPIGEKGIGRLGVHKLGDSVQIISKTKDDPEVSFKVDWSHFERTENMRDLEPIQIITHDVPRFFMDKKTGTKIIIQNLKERFEEKEIRELQLDLTKILPPFESVTKDNFSIQISTQNGLFYDDKTLDIEYVKNHALFHFRVVINQEQIKDFEYHFRSPNEQKIPSRNLYLQDITEAYAHLLEKYPINFPDLGDIILEGYMFDETLSKQLGSGYPPDVKAYLKINGGIRVYRDGMRVYNYGEGGKDNDILDLDRKRAHRLGDNIGYNQLLAAIQLDRARSKQLVEKTNREGFIHNEAFLSMQSSLDFCMELVMHFRKIDRANMKDLMGKPYDKTDILTKVNTIIRQVKKSSMAEQDKIKISADIQAFAEDFDQVKNIFLTAANNGLNLTFVVHEVDKILDHLEEKIKGKDLSQVESIFLHLKNTINAYRETMKVDKKAKPLSVTGIIDQVIFNSDYRFISHGIVCETDVAPDLSIKGKKGLIIGIFTNLLDNSIYWLQYYKINPKQIFIRAYKKGDHVVLVVADNGKGFNIGFEAALKPFITGRMDDSSMGIGLHLAEQVMAAHQGTITHSDWQTENLPQAFSQGAVIKLTFMNNG